MSSGNSPSPNFAYILVSINPWSSTELVLWEKWEWLTPPYNIALVHWSSACVCHMLLSPMWRYCCDWRPEFPSIKPPPPAPRQHESAPFSQWRQMGLWGVSRLNSWVAKPPWNARLVWDRNLCTSGWHWTWYVARDCLELRMFPPLLTNAVIIDIIYSNTSFMLRKELRAPCIGGKCSTDGTILPDPDSRPLTWLCKLVFLIYSSSSI